MAELPPGYQHGTTGLATLKGDQANALAGVAVNQDHPRVEALVVMATG